LFTPDVLKACELQLYAYMARDLIDGKRLVRSIARALAGTNKMVSRDFLASVEGVRMSGDMCTSLGNGFTNLMLMLFLCKENGADAVGVVEGDDGLFRIRGNPPTKEQFANLGFRIKMEENCDVGKAGFCKQYFDTVVKENVIDPVELLCKFGWSHSLLRQGGPATVRALLRAKADSLEAEMPAAPIAGALVRMVRRCIGEGKRLYEGARGGPDWYHGVARGVLCPVSMKSRVLVADLFGVSVAKQLEIEYYLDGIQVLQPLAGPVTELMKKEWCDFYSRYGRAYPGGQELSW